jgi:hypothetical protein
MRVHSLQILFAIVIAGSSSAFADVEKVATICEKAICPHWWPKVSVPAGWQHDRDYSLHFNFNALAPQGKSFADADTVMYANAVYKPRVPESKTLQEFIATDHANFRRETRDLSIVSSGNVTTADGKSALTWLLEPKTTGQWERVAYVEEGDYYMVFVISSRTQAGRNAGMPSFESLLNQYKE